MYDAKKVATRPVSSAPAVLKSVYAVLMTDFSLEPCLVRTRKQASLLGALRRKRSW